MEEGVGGGECLSRGKKGGGKAIHMIHKLPQHPQVILQPESFNIVHSWTAERRTVETTRFTFHMDLFHQTVPGSNRELIQSNSSRNKGSAEVKNQELRYPRTKNRTMHEFLSWVFHCVQQNCED